MGYLDPLVLYPPESFGSSGTLRNQTKSVVGRGRQRFGQYPFPRGSNVLFGLWAI